MGTRRRVASDHEDEWTLPDGRTMTWAEFGAPTGRAVVVSDGAGSRLQGRLADAWATEHEVRLLTPDRPGFFGSTPSRDTTFASVADDLAAWLDHLDVPRAGVFALSGGTAFGCALAAAHPERIATLGLLGPIAPIDGVGSRAGMDRPTATAFLLGRHAPWAMAGMIGFIRWQTDRDLDRAAERFTALRPAQDQEVIRRPDVWPILRTSFPDISQSPSAAAHEFRLMARPWGFDPAGIEVPTHVWAGGADTVHPPSHARWLAGRIPGATIEERDGAGIFGFLDDYPRLLEVIAAPAG